MEQTSLFQSAEAQVYALLEPELLAVLDANWADRRLLRMEEHKNYSSILFGSSVLARLSGGSNPSVHLLKGSLPVPEAQEDGNFYRLSLPILDKARDYLPQMCEALQSLIDRIPKEFSCCSRYEQCSGARACVNPDRDLALRCAYRKVLRRGTVYFGENRNV